MKLGEVRAQVPGLPKRFVHYLESQGYIQPIKVKKERISRRDYTDEDLQTIKGAGSITSGAFPCKAPSSCSGEPIETKCICSRRSQPASWARLKRYCATMIAWSR